MPQDLVDGGVATDGIARIGEEDAERLAQHRLRPGDIVYGRRGDIGRRALIGKREAGWLCGTGCIRIRLGDSVVRPRFLFYYLGQPKVIAWIANQAIGATLPNLNTSIIRRIAVSYPDLQAQRKLEAILSAYDDLIENNTKRIRILEEMARAIYREWFVEFRAPGVKLRKATAAERKVTGREDFPVGWEINPIGDVVVTVGGGTPSTKQENYWEGGDITWFTPSDLTAARAMLITECAKKITRAGLEGSSARLFPPYSVMMTSRATIGVVSINTTEACTNQGFITCIPNQRVSSAQLYFWTEENKEAIVSVASGATYKEINRSEFREMPIVVATNDAQSEFVDATAPIVRLVENLLRARENIRRTRDFLLPKLVSGEVSVEDLDIKVGEEAKVPA